MKKGDDIEDLMGLIELAEKSTDRLNKLKDQIFDMVVFVFITIMVFFTFYFLSRQFLHETLEVSYSIFDLIFAAFISILIFPFGRDIIKKSKNIQTEIKITDKLYNLIDPLKSSLEDEMSIIKMATIEMRLSRLFFEGSNKKLISYKTKEITNAKAQKELILET